MTLDQHHSPSFDRSWHVRISGLTFKNDSRCFVSLLLVFCFMFSPTCCCPNHERLARKIPTISETEGGGLPPPGRAPMVPSVGGKFEKQSLISVTSLGLN